MPRQNKGRMNHKKRKPEPESESESESDSMTSSSESDDEDYTTSDALRDEETSEIDTTSRSSYTDEGDASESDESKKISKKEFRKTLATLFPSKYSKNRAKMTKSSDDWSDESESPKKKKMAKKKRKIVVSSEEEDESGMDTDDDKNSESTDRTGSSASSRSSTETEEDSGKQKQFTFVMNFNKNNEDEEIDEFEEESNDECNSDDEKTFMAEKYEKVELEPSKIRETKKEKKSKKKNKEEKEPTTEDIEYEYTDLIEMKKFYTQRLNKNPKNKHMKKLLDDCLQKIKELVKRSRSMNTNKYNKLINEGADNENSHNEIQYFKKKLSHRDQLKIMEDLKEINRFMNIDKPYRLILLQSNIHPKFKAIAMQKLNALHSMEPSDNEYHKIKNWVDNFMKIPFGVYRNLTIKQSDGIDVCDKFLTDAKRTLDTCVYGLNDAKLQIMQMLGQWIVNPDSIGSAIAIHGPPGTGKTSIVKDGISRILGRDFAFIALGGCGDGSFLEGHSYTYEGSTWGKITQILMESKSMNPVIYFDELDKISDTPRGQEIIGILTHLTDSTQNSQFHDKYFSELEFDLSKCLFIFSYNEEALVNPILKDRMYRIKTSGYDVKEKITIARDYLLPKLREQVNFNAEDVIIPDDTLQYIIGNAVLTKNESGVRNLKRCLEIIYTKLNLFRLVKPENSIFEKEMNTKIKFPMTVTRKDVDLFIKNNEPLNPSMLAMYC